MKTALLTGRTGFIGQNIMPVLREKFDLLAPDRSELDLRNAASVKDYILSHRIDAVFHCANPNPTKNQADKPENMITDSVRQFLNLYSMRKYYGKMMYLGSGAEYDKSLDISNISEKECFRSVPSDDYGLAKYTENLIADKSENIYNLCLFGCYGPNDHYSKFITHCIRCCLKSLPITIRQDCRFDYIHVSDLGRIMVWFGENRPKHHMYNISGCQHAFLSEIAEEVRRQMNSVQPIEILSEGLNKEYTADGTRFRQESGLEPSISLKDGIALQIKWEKEHFNETESR